METILNITNGDSAVKVMREAGLPGLLLPWRDVLHEGPVPADLSLESLSEVRTKFIIDQGWGEAEAVRKDFIERDKALQSYMSYSKILLWFEHDLYDQLQLLQILDWFSQKGPEGIALNLICTEQYLGMTTPDEIEALQPYEETITGGHLEIAKRAWQAFRSPTPEAWHGLLDQDTSILPFLKGAVIRLLEEYPSASNGLSRTAQQALQIISEGETRAGRVFHRYQETEERRFMGDASFWGILHQLLADPPLLRLPEGKELTLPIRPDQELSITPTGREVLAGRRNWLEIVALDRWIGGVHLAPGNVWCWNTDSGSLIKRT